MNDTLIDAVILLFSVQVFLPPHQRDEVERLAMRIGAELSPPERARMVEVAKERAEARDAARERHDDEVIYIRAPELPADPNLVWRLGLLRGKRVAVESWLAGEQFPEEMLIEVTTEDEQLRQQIYGKPDDD
jgi:hypothetical protein